MKSNKRIAVNVSAFDYAMLSILADDCGYSLSGIVREFMIVPFRRSFLSALNDPKQRERLEALLRVEFEKMGLDFDDTPYSNTGCSIGGASDE